jgi:hypothetical protein
LTDSDYCLSHSRHLSPGELAGIAVGALVGSVLLFWGLSVICNYHANQYRHTQIGTAPAPGGPGVVDLRYNQPNPYDQPSAYSQPQASPWSQASYGQPQTYDPPPPYYSGQVSSQKKYAAPENDAPQSDAPQTFGPGDATPQNAAPQNAAPQNAAPQNAVPENVHQNAAPNNDAPVNRFS